jgi:hypothetical protein
VSPFVTSKTKTLWFFMHIRWQEGVGFICRDDVTRGALFIYIYFGEGKDMTAAGCVSACRLTLFFCGFFLFFFGYMAAACPVSLGVGLTRSATSQVGGSGRQKKKR